MIMDSTIEMEEISLECLRKSEIKYKDENLHDKYLIENKKFF